MKTLLFFFAFTFFFISGFSQNYLGYSKEYIIKALKSERKDMKGPVVVKAVKDNFIIYLSKNGRRSVYYHFKEVDFISETGKVTREDICTNYISKNLCQGYAQCPEMEEVIRSLNSHFTPTGQHHIWIDYSKTIPHEWVIVKDNDYFEVYVSELKE